MDSMTTYETISFIIFVTMTVGFFAWIAYLKFTR